MAVAGITPSKMALFAILSILGLSAIIAVFIEPIIALFLVGILMFLIFFFQTKAGIFVYSFYLAFEETILQHVPVSFFFVLKYSGDLLLALLLFAVFTKLAIRRYNLSAVRGNPFNIPLVVFLIIALFSMIINGVPLFVGVAGMRQLLRYIVLYFVMLIICTSSDDWTVKTTKNLIKLILVMVFVQAGIGYLQLLFGPGSAFNYFLAPGKGLYYEGVLVGSYYTTAEGRALFGTFLTRNTYGLFLMCGLLLTLGLLYESKDFRRRKIFLFGLAVLLPCILLTYSRLAILGAVLGVLIIAIIKHRFRLVTILMIGVIGFSIYARGYIKPAVIVEPDVVTLSQRIASPFTRRYLRHSLQSDRLAAVRLFGPKVLFSKYAFMGLGPGAFGTPVGLSLNYFEAYKKIGTDLSNPRYRQLALLLVDVGYLALLGQYGILGLIAILWIFVSLFRYLYRKYLDIEDEFFRGIFLGICSYLIVFMLTWVGELSIEIRQLSYYFWLMAALLVSLPRKAAEEAVREE